MVFVFVGHDLLGLTDEIIIHTGHLILCIFYDAVFILQSVCACQIQQRIAVIEQRRSGNNLFLTILHEKEKFNFQFILLLRYISIHNISFLFIPSRGL